MASKTHVNFPTSIGFQNRGIMSNSLIGYGCNNVDKLHSNPIMDEAAQKRKQMKLKNRMEQERRYLAMQSELKEQEQEQWEKEYRLQLEIIENDKPYLFNRYLEEGELQRENALKGLLGSWWNQDIVRIVRTEIQQNQGLLRQALTPEPSKPFQTPEEERSWYETHKGWNMIHENTISLWTTGEMPFKLDQMNRCTLKLLELYKRMDGHSRSFYFGKLIGKLVLGKLGRFQDPQDTWAFLNTIYNLLSGLRFRDLNLKVLWFGWLRMEFALCVEKAHPVFSYPEVRRGVTILTEIYKEVGIHRKDVHVTGDLETLCRIKYGSWRWDQPFPSQHCRPFTPPRPLPLMNDANMNIQPHQYHPSVINRFPFPRTGNPIGVVVPPTPVQVQPTPTSRDTAQEQNRDDDRRIRNNISERETSSCKTSSNCATHQLANPPQKSQMYDHNLKIGMRRILEEEQDKFVEQVEPEVAKPNPRREIRKEDDETLKKCEDIQQIVISILAGQGQQGQNDMKQITKCITQLTNLYREIPDGSSRGCCFQKLAVNLILGKIGGFKDHTDSWHLLKLICKFLSAIKFRHVDLMDLWLGWLHMEFAYCVEKADEMESLSDVSTVARTINEIYEGDVNVMDDLDLIGRTKYGSWRWISVGEPDPPNIMQFEPDTDTDSWNSQSSSEPDTTLLERVKANLSRSLPLTHKSKSMLHSFKQKRRPEEEIEKHKKRQSNPKSFEFETFRTPQTIRFKTASNCQLEKIPADEIYALQRKSSGKPRKISKSLMDDNFLENPLNPLTIDPYAFKNIFNLAQHKDKCIESSRVSNDTPTPIANNSGDNDDDNVILRDYQHIPSTEKPETAFQQAKRKIDRSQIQNAKSAVVRINGDIREHYLPLDYSSWEYFTLTFSPNYKSISTKSFGGYNVICIEHYIVCKEEIDVSAESSNLDARMETEIND